MTGSLLEIKELRFSYPGSDFQISIPNIKIKPGEITTILGPNGSGKSTLLSLIRGRLKPTSGQILSNGLDIRKLSDTQRAGEMGYTPQRSYCPPGFSVEELTEGGFYRFQNQTPPVSLDEILTRLDLSELRFREGASLSGGEFRRVLLARLLAQDPKILLLDEPGGDLDLKYQERLPKLMREEAERGKTVIVILHDINQALHATDKTILIKDGSPQFFGPSKEIITAENIEKIYGVKLRYYFPEGGGNPILGFF